MIVSIFSPLILSEENETYLKKIEALEEKFVKNKNYSYSLEYDKVSIDENLKFYKILLDKLQHGIYQSRPSNFSDILVKGIDSFEGLSMFEQVKMLLALVASFGTTSNAGIDLKGIQGSAKSGVTTLGANLSNWKKNFKQAYLIYSDAAGLHETKSVNLLDLLK